MHKYTQELYIDTMLRDVNKIFPCEFLESMNNYTKQWISDRMSDTQAWDTSSIADLMLCWLVSRLYVVVFTHDVAEQQ